MQRWLPFVLISIGGALGANARYLVGRWIGNLTEARFPVGTFVINISGSFFLGLLGWLISQRLIANGDHWRLAIGIGFIGAYTTFSTFEYETHSLFEDGLWLSAVTNMLLSLFVGLLAVRAGVAVAKWWFA